jgi:hypothetical protein
MNLGQFRLLTRGLPDDTPVLVPASDHSYRSPDAEVGTALHDQKSRTWTEDYGEETTPAAQFGARTKAVIIR